MDFVGLRWMERQARACNRLLGIGHFPGPEPSTSPPLRFDHHHGSDSTVTADGRGTGGIYISILRHAACKPWTWPPLSGESMHSLVPRVSSLI